MGSDISVDADRFAASLENILERLGVGVSNGIPQAVEDALVVGEKEWKANARSVLSSSYSRGGWGKVKKHEYYKSGPRKGQIKGTEWYGKNVRTGKYARSITHRMMSSGGLTPEGEIGSRSLPGLAHLLEKGHAQIGGGFVAGREHIAPAADEAFDRFEKFVEGVIDDVINSL